MHTILFVIAVFLSVIYFLLLLFGTRIKKTKWFNQLPKWLSEQWAYKQFMQLPPYEWLFQMFWDGFLFFGSLIIVLITSRLQVVNMTTLLVIFIICVIFAIAMRARILLEPNDNRLDKLMTKVDTLTDSINNLVNKTNPPERDIGLVNKEMRDVLKQIKGKNGTSNNDQSKPNDEQDYNI
jgi:hypothetical protein